MEDIKKRVENCIGKEVVIITDIDKKKRKSIRCIVKEVYRSVFIVQEVNKDEASVRSFTYADIHSNQILFEIPN